MGLVQGMFGRAKGFVLWLFGWEEPVQSSEHLIDHHIHDMTLTLGRCKVQVARLIKEQRDLQEKIHRNTNLITSNLREARNAAARGEEEVATDHLRAKVKCEATGTKLQEQLAFFKQQSERLVDTVRSLELRLEETKRKKMLLITQRQCAEAQLLLGGANGADGEGMRELLSSLEEEVLEKQAKAMLETEVDGGVPSALSDTELREGAMTQKVEDDLAQIKAGLARGRKELPQAAPPPAATEPDSESESDDEIFIIK